jgi:subtilisin family serine protease
MSPFVGTKLSVLPLEDRTTPAAFVEGQVLVGIDPTVAPFVLPDLDASNLTTTIEHLGYGVYKVGLTGGVSVDQGVRNLKLPGVKYVEPNYKIFRKSLPNDPDVQSGLQWHLNNFGQSGGTAGADVDANGAWDIGVGTGEKILAIFDDGLEHTHPDLAANMWVNTGEVPGNGVDDDGNGQIDDIHGFNFGTNSGNVLPDAANDHGTHVGGIAGSVGNNGVGGSGAIWRTRLMSIPIFDGGSAVSNAVAGMAYAERMGADISNHSWGFQGPESLALRAAVQGHEAAGIIFVSAAGNTSDDNDTVDDWPTNYNGIFKNAVSVAASDRNDRLADFTSFGRTTVAVAAPGVDIQSTVTNAGYGLKSGTSMASPLVAGILTAYWDQNPDLTYLEVIQDLFNTVAKLPELDGKVSTGGLVNFAELMALSKSPYFATGTGAGVPGLVNVYNPRGRLIRTIQPYDAGFTGGVRVAAGDVNGDGFTDIITAAGPSGGPHLRVFDAKTGTEIGGFFSADPSFNGGLTVTTGDVDGDGRMDIIVGTDTGGGPRVTVFRYNPESLLFDNVADFFAYAEEFNKGVRVAAADIDGDGKADIITAPATGGGPHVKVFSGASLLAGDYLNPIRSFFAGSESDARGLFVAAGHISSKTSNDIIVSTGSSNNPTVRVYHGTTLELLQAYIPPDGQGGPTGLVVDEYEDLSRAQLTYSFPNDVLPPAGPLEQLPYAKELVRPKALNGYAQGVRIATMDVNRDGFHDIIMTSGPSDTPRVNIVNSQTGKSVRSYMAYSPTFYGGVFVGAPQTF